MDATGAESAIGGGTAVGFRALCQQAVVDSGLSLGTFRFFDFIDSTAQLTGGAAIVPDPTLSNGAYKLGTGGANGTVQWGATNQVLIAAPKTEPWLFRTEFQVNGAFTVGKTVDIMDWSDAGGANQIALTSIPGTGPQWFMFFDNAGTPASFSTGVSPGDPTCPLGAWVVAQVWFDLTTLRVSFNGATALSLTGSQLNGMPTAGQILFQFASDATALLKLRTSFLATT
jgi:hypothetical protein